MADPAPSAASPARTVLSALLIGVWTALVTVGVLYLADANMSFRFEREIAARLDRLEGGGAGGADGPRLEALEGKIEALQGQVGALDATVSTADIEASNGVIHVIDSVLMPDAAM